MGPSLTRCARPGARAQVGGNPERLLTCASAPFPAGTGTPDAGDAVLDKSIRSVLFKLRFDISANAIKTLEATDNIKAPLELWLGPKEAPEVAELKPGETCQTGYFQGGGLQLRPLLGIFRVRPSPRRSSSARAAAARRAAAAALRLRRLRLRRCSGRRVLQRTPLMRSRACARSSRWCCCLPRGAASLRPRR